MSDVTDRNILQLAIDVSRHFSKGYRVYSEDPENLARLILTSRLKKLPQVREVIIRPSEWIVAILVSGYNYNPTEKLLGYRLERVCYDNSDQSGPWCVTMENFDPRMQNFIREKLADAGGFRPKGDIRRRMYLTWALGNLRTDAKR